MNGKHLESRYGDPQLEGRIQSLEMAFRMQFEAREAFDLSRETPATRALYGEGKFADACLIARRLAERGVRISQIYYGRRPALGRPRRHGQPPGPRQEASDAPIAALLADLKARGLFDETLVVWGGEFGRTPTSQGSKGRDHHNTGFTMWLAGGGVKAGHVHGSTDEFGWNAIEDRVHVHDLHATVLHLMGIDHEKLTYRYSGRDFRLTDVHGEVVKGIIAWAPYRPRPILSTGFGDAFPAGLRDGIRVGHPRPRRPSAPGQRQFQSVLTQGVLGRSRGRPRARGGGGRRRSPRPGESVGGRGRVALTALRVDRGSACRSADGNTLVRFEKVRDKSSASRSRIFPYGSAPWRPAGRPVPEVGRPRRRNARSSSSCSSRAGPPARSSIIIQPAEPVGPS